MRIAVITNQNEVDSLANQFFNQYGSLHDGDMMILSQGQIILEAVSYGSSEEAKAIIYEFKSEDICNLSELKDFDYRESQDFVSATVFDDVKEAKLYMINRAAESMSLNDLV